MNNSKALNGHDAFGLGFAVLHIDSHRLLLPQSEVAILELLDTMVPSPAAPAVGELPFANAQWPVYCLKGAELSLSAGLPASRYVCALLHDGSGGYLGLACDTVEQLAAEAVSLRPVPHCMRSDTMLITELALESEQNVLWVCNVRHLVSWLSRNSEGVNHG